MTESVTKIVNERSDSVKLIRGQKGNYGFEVKIYSDILSDEGRKDLLDKLKEMAKTLEENFTPSI